MVSLLSYPERHCVRNASSEGCPRPRERGPASQLDAALGELRAAGWPSPEDPDGDDDAELDGREHIADRLVDEVGWLRQCAGWLTRLHAGGFPLAVNLRPGGDHPERALVVVDLPRVAAILDRIAADIDELARTRRVDDLAAAAVLPGRRAERRRRAAEPDLDFREFCRRQPPGFNLGAVTWGFPAQYGFDLGV